MYYLLQIQIYLVVYFDHFYIEAEEEAARGVLYIFPFEIEKELLLILCEMSK